ncbi:MAG: TonB-dependent receptor [Rickettsiales bacterium]|nr:TonB-dependent receptor [Rickettsiales bacterium]
MKKIIRIILLISLLPIIILYSSISLAKNSPQTLPSITVTATNTEDDYFKSHIQDTGAIEIIDNQEIYKKQSNDINRILRDVPSLNLQEEDGYGIRPNIGIRGSRNDRSADIVIMEDYVPIAPAPYSAPSAYYFPAIGRTNNIEIYKGLSSIKFGPRTTSGALNINTVPIPDKHLAKISTSYGSFNEQNATLTIGNSFDHFGYIFNVDHKSSDGFKEIDNGSDVGFKIDDFLTKFRFNNDKSSDIYHEFEIKLAHTNEDSNESYIGLDFGDFVSDPYKRYNSSSLGGMLAKQYQVNLTHTAEFNDKFSIKTTAYYNKFDRIWTRLNKVSDGATSENVKDIFNNNLTSHLNIIKGDISNNPNHNLEINANNRFFVSQGIQSFLTNKFKALDADHTLTYGFRAHDDYENRFQRIDDYKLNEHGNLYLVNKGIDGATGSNNRFSTVRAYSAFIEDEAKFNKLTITAGLRFEHLDIKRKNYGNDNSDRNDEAETVKNTEDVFIPGIGANYLLKDNWSIFANVHKGFGPPSPGSEANSEESVNYELGTKYKTNNELLLEGVFYLNNYSNLVGTSSDGTESQINSGKVRSYGIELSSSYEIISDSLSNKFQQDITFPIKFTYSYNNSEFRSNFNASDTIDEWGNVEKGDKLPYISPHQFSLSGGVKSNKLELNISTKYVDAMRATASQGTISKENKIPSHFLVDSAVFYNYSKNLTLILAAENIFNRTYLVATRPAGYRPGKPQTFRAGLKYKF